MAIHGDTAETSVVPKAVGHSNAVHGALWDISSSIFSELYSMLENLQLYHVKARSLKIWWS